MQCQMRVTCDYELVRTGIGLETQENDKILIIGPAHISPVYSDSTNVRSTNAILTHIQIKRP
jgi:hypothetical protein